MAATYKYEPRMMMGMDLWLQGAVKPLGKGRFEVRSQSNPAVAYLVFGASCNCFDYQKHQLPCKHRFAVALQVCERKELEEKSAQAPKPAPVPAPTADTWADEFPTSSRPLPPTKRQLDREMARIFG